MKKSLGITLLEAAMTMVFVSFLLLFSAGLWDYVKSSNAVSELLENYSSRSYKGALRYNKNIGKYETDFSDLKNMFLEELAEQAVSKLKKDLRDSSDANKRVEFLFATASVNPQTGELTGLKAFSETDIVGYGNQRIPGFLKDNDNRNGEIGFQEAINTYIRQNQANLAIPSYNYGISGSNNKFLSEVPLLAARALYNFGDSSILKSLGIIEHTFVWDIKVSALRGDL